MQYPVEYSRRRLQRYNYDLCFLSSANEGEQPLRYLTVNEFVSQLRSLHLGRRYINLSILYDAVYTENKTINMFCSGGNLIHNISNDMPAR